MILSFLLGAILGSFLNMAVYRSAKDISFLTKRSVCDFCGKVLHVRAMIPVLSFLIDSGKTQCCKKDLPLKYPLVEISIGALFVLWYLIHIGDYITIIQGWVFIVIIGFVFLLDTYEYLVSLPWTWGSMILVFAFHLFLKEPLWMFFGGALIGGGFYAFQYILSRGVWVGEGDISLGALFGIMFGFPQILVLFFISYIIGAFVGISLLYLGKKGMKSRLPMGSFLAVGSLITLFFGDRILEYYLSFL